MQKIIRLISLILALVMLLPCIVACGDDPNDKNNNKDDMANTNDEIKTKLPEMDWAGAEFRVLACNAGFASNFEVSVDEYPEDVVGQAVYNRNEMLRQKYNFVITQDADAWTNDVAQVTYEASDDLYDLVLYRPYRVQAHAQKGYLLNLLDSETLPYLDLEHDSWDPYINQQLTVAGKLFYCSNDFLLQDKRRTQLIFYNRETARNLRLGLYPEAEMPFEEMVYNNEWTLENFETIIKNTYADNDGLQGATEMDQYGLAMEIHGNYLGLVMGAGFQLSNVDSKGNLRLVGATDKMINILDRVLAITANKNLTYDVQTNYPSLAQIGEHIHEHFLEGRFLMIADFMSFYDLCLDASGVEIGALPNPKYDAEQERYYTCTNTTNGSIFAMPYTITDTDRASFCLEALTEASTNTTYRAYIDTKCKYQDAYDEDCAKMMEIAFSGTVYDIAGICDFGGLYKYVRSDIQNTKKNGFARFYQQNAKAAHTGVTQLIEDYNKMQ